MASVATIPAHSKSHSGARTRVEHRQLFDSMERVRGELERVRAKPDADNVHDLRVAIRRCRSVAKVFEEIDPDKSWPGMRNATRKLFRALGALRDGHVMEDWVKRLTPAEDPVRAHMSNLFEADEPELRDELLRIAQKFDDKKWKRLQRRLRRRVRFVPVGGLAAECLAWERFEEIKQLHAHALRSDKAKPWHSLRIGLKKLRYTVETLLPEHHAAWHENLKRLQDLLGDIHDLDVLAEKVKAETDAAGPARAQWKENIHREREERMQTYRRLTLGKTSIWNTWRHTLPHGERLEAASLARLRATARAAQSRPREVVRISVRIFDLLRRAKAAPLFADPNMRRNLRAAALLHAVANDDKHPRKAAWKFLSNMDIPPRWTREDWDQVAWVVRFHRGAEPTVEDSEFGKLSPAMQDQIRTLAGLVRLGRVLYKSGVESARGFKLENVGDVLTLLIPNLVDNLESAAKFAVGKHLLETALGKPLVLRAAEKILTVVEESEPSETQLYAVANASD